MKVADFDRIHEHSGERVPSGYGSMAYYHRLDQGARALKVVNSTHQAVNWLVRVYPFGFYAFEALWLRLVALFTDSLTVLFFAARLLCVAMAAIALYCNYRTAITLGIPQGTSVALTAIVGTFPLTSYVSSYVQPDNLAYLLVSLTTLLTARLCRGAKSTTTIPLIAIALGVLAVTKYQFFISMSLPVLGAIAWRLRSNYNRTRAIIAAITASLIPSAALLLVQRYVSVGPASLATGTPYMRFAAFNDGMGATVLLLAHETLVALQNYFISGVFVASFWGVLGWADTALIVVNPAIQNATRTIIACLTVVVVSIMVIQSVRNAARLLRVAQRGKRRLATAIAVRDPLLSTYFIFVGIMTALFVATNDAFGATGRHWFPFTFTAFACGAWYAPKCLGRWRNVGSTFVVSGMLIYSVLAASYALLDLHHRFYSMPVQPYVPAYAHNGGPIFSGHAVGALAEPDTIAYHVPDSIAHPATFPIGTHLTIQGVAVDLQNRSAARHVFVLLDGHTALKTRNAEFTYAFELLHDARYAYSGFSGDIDTSRLAIGSHTVSAYVMLPDNIHALEIPFTRTFLIRSKLNRKFDEVTDVR